MFTKTRGGAEVPSRKADYLEFSPDGAQAIVGNKNPIGLTTTTQTNLGVWYPNIQSAIDDLSSMLTGNIGDVVINTSGINPAGIQQVTQIAFSGTASVQISTAPGTIITSAKTVILGFPITVDDGDTSDQIATKLKAEMDTYVLQNKVIDNVTQDGTDPGILSIRHIDYQNHDVEDFNVYGVSAVMTVASPPKVGYGTWFKIGQEAKTFGGGTVSYTLNYFQRIA